MWRKTVLGCLTVLFASSVLVWYQFHNRPVPRDLALGIRETVQRYPRLQPLFDQAMSDGVLTMAEADRILNEAEDTATETE